MNRSLNAMVIERLEGDVRPAGAGMLTAPVETSYAPKFILGATRTQDVCASLAASSAERPHSSLRPSSPGRRSGHSETTPWRVMVVMSKRGEISPASSSQSRAIHEVDLALLFQLEHRRLELEPGIGVRPHELLAVRLADGHGDQLLLHAQGRAEVLAEAQALQVDADVYPRRVRVDLLGDRLLCCGLAVRCVVRFGGAVPVISNDRYGR